MKKPWIFLLFVGLLLNFSISFSKEKVIIDFDHGKISANVQCDDATVRLKSTANGDVLEVTTGFNKETARIILTPRKANGWDFSNYSRIVISVKNLSDVMATFWATVIGEENGHYVSSLVPGAVTLNPGEKGAINVWIYAFGRKLIPKTPIIGMDGIPAGSGPIDPKHIQEVDVFVDKPFRSYNFEINDMRLEGEVKVVKASDFFPFIDRFGQFKYSDWPGKTHSLNELIKADRRECMLLKNTPDPSGWDRFGGWLTGPTMKSTGFFYTTKYKGKWWLVDPDGHLFFSQGVDGVGENSFTPVSFRENYFEWLPDTVGIFAECWRDVRKQAAHGFYKTHFPFKAVSFDRANLIRKYGNKWREKYTEECHLRLRKWGINTMGSWSSEFVFSNALPFKTPYVVCASSENAKRIEGASGWWRKFPDPFDESFRKSIRNSLHAFIKSANDPWCIGFFVDNEQTWRDDLYLAQATLISPAKQPVKIRFMHYLRSHYQNIQKLDKIWGVNLLSWKDFLERKIMPDTSRLAVKEDLKKFSKIIYKEYFRISRQEVKRIAPHQMYLGCRFSANMMHNRTLQIIAAEYCDVITYNIYNLFPAGFDESLDKPVLIGEFHFGALDRGMFHTGLWYAKDQKERASLYESYVRYALRNPLIVGTHWFKFPSESTTARSDGENFQIGFIDVCDHPYPELISAAREIGNTMYQYRISN